MLALHSLTAFIPESIISIRKLEIRPGDLQSRNCYYAGFLQSATPNRLQTRLHSINDLYIPITLTPTLNPSQMPHPRTRQPQRHNTPHTLPQNQPAGKHNQRPLLPSPARPPQTHHPAHRPRERKTRLVVHPHRDGDPAGHETLPRGAQGENPHRGGDGE